MGLRITSYEKVNVNNTHNVLRQKKSHIPRVVKKNILRWFWYLLCSSFQWKWDWCQFPFSVESILKFASVSHPTPSLRVLSAADCDWKTEFTPWRKRARCVGHTASTSVPTTCREVAWCRTSFPSHYPPRQWNRSAYGGCSFCQANATDTVAMMIGIATEIVDM